MKQDLKQALTQYKNYTLDLISVLEKEEFDSLDKVLNERQFVIEEINNIDYTREEFKVIVEELEILILQKKLTELINEKRNNTRIELDNIVNSKKANKNYNRKFYSDSMFFNKKI